MRSKNLACILLGSVLLQATPALAVDWNWNNVPTNTKELDKAMSAYAAGEVETALVHLNGMKNGASDDPRARHILYEIYREQKRYSEAHKELSDMQTVFQRYVATHTVSPAWMNPASIKSEMGDLALDQGNFNEAISCYREASSGSPQAKGQIARVYEMQGDIEGARNQYKSILESGSGMTAGEKGYYMDRLAELEKRAPQQGQPGQGQPGQGQPGQGQPGQGQPGQGQPGGFGSLGQSGHGQPGLPGMSSSVTSIPGATPGAVRVSTPKGTGPLQVAADKISSKKYDEAITLLKSVVGKAPSNAQAHYLLAVSYVCLRQYAPAREEYESTLKYAQDLGLQKLASAGLTKIQGKQ